VPRVVFILPSVLWRNRQIETRLVLRHILRNRCDDFEVKSPNRTAGFETQTEKPSTTDFEAKLGETVAIDFEAKLG
jgi:hypothetical protein